jgi:inorganic pyrophosphatase
LCRKNDTGAPLQAMTPRLDQLPSTNDDGHVLAVIEASRGSRTKLKFDTQLGVLTLHGVLPEGLAYPYDFGFVPSTLAEDGDPLDVLVLTDEPTPPGAVVPCRLLGVLVAMQGSGRRAVRNDRLLAAAVHSRRYAEVTGLDGVAREVLDEIQRFFVAHNEARGERFEARRRGGPAQAARLLAAARRAAVEAP